MKSEITVNLMVRNEKLVFYSIMSYAPYVNKVLVCDTGSADNTINDINYAKEIMLSKYGYDNIELYTAKELIGKECPDLTDYNCAKLADGTQKVSQEITDVRQKLRDISETEWLFQPDGDEIYFQKTMQDVYKKLETISNDNNIACINLPLIWFIQDLHHVFFVYPVTTRLHRRIDCNFYEPFPREEVRDRHGNRLIPTSNRGVTLDTTPFYHYSRILKPMRNDGTEHTRHVFKGEHPKVFYDYPEILRREGFVL